LLSSEKAPSTKARYAKEPSVHSSGPDPERTRITPRGLADMRTHLRKLRPATKGGGRAVRVLHYPHMPRALADALGQPYWLVYAQHGGLPHAYALPPASGESEGDHDDGGRGGDRCDGYALSGEPLGTELLEEVRGLLAEHGLDEWALAVPREDAVALMGVMADVELAVA
jgi:hypothetical protein